MTNRIRGAGASTAHGKPRPRDTQPCLTLERCAPREGGGSGNRHRVGCGCSRSRARPTYLPPLDAKGRRRGQKKKKDLIIDLTSSRPPPLVSPSDVGRLPFLAQRYDTMRRRRLSTRANTGARVRGKGFRFNFPLAAVFLSLLRQKTPLERWSRRGGVAVPTKETLQVYPSLLPRNRTVAQTRTPRRRFKPTESGVECLYQRTCAGGRPYSNWPPATKVVVRGFVWLAHEPLGHELGHRSVGMATDPLGPDGFVRPLSTLTEPPGP